jgi:hypothetical protein
LYGVWGSNATNLYSVGDGYNGKTYMPLIYHSAGGAWKVISSTMPSGWTYGWLRSIWGSSSSNILAVGTGEQGGPDLPLIYHLITGNVLKVSSPAMPSGFTTGGLYGVWGSRANNEYVVGYGYNGTAELPLIYQSTVIGGWNVFSPAMPSGFTAGTLNSVWGSGDSGNVYAVGYGWNAILPIPLVYHKYGSVWKAIAPPLPTGWTAGWLNGVYVPSAGYVVAVGSGYIGTAQVPLVYHSNNGSIWTVSSLPIPSGWSDIFLRGIWGSDASNEYAVGSGYNGTTYMPLLYHYNGTAWTFFTPAVRSGENEGELWGVWGSSAANVYMVGEGDNGTTWLPLIYH